MSTVMTWPPVRSSIVYLLLPFKPGIPAYKLQAKMRSRARNHALLHATTSCLLSRGSRPHLPAWEGSGATTCPTAPVLSPAQEGSVAATCPMAPDLASLLGRAFMLPCIPWLRTLPPWLAGLQCCHVSHSPQSTADLKN
jgi:hypothetical protein